MSLGFDPPAEPVQVRHLLSEGDRQKELCHTWNSMSICYQSETGKK